MRVLIEARVEVPDVLRFTRMRQGVVHSLVSDRRAFGRDCYYAIRIFDVVVAAWAKGQTDYWLGQDRQ
jgi:hypothetical protein